jgi:diguanylate cyclase (GGDEF)-like protein/PAS domain S-box-containing protein
MKRRAVEDPGTPVTPAVDAGCVEAAPSPVRTKTADRSISPSRVSPTLISYLMGPFALGVILLLMHFKLVSRQPIALWVAVFVLTPFSSMLAEAFYVRRQTALRQHARVAAHAAAVTAVIYLSGWGPVLVVSFAFVALENMSRGGSRVWRMAAFWSLVGIAIGQIAIWQHWFPSELALWKANSLALMEGFVLLFVIRLAGAVMEEKESAEASLKLSEDRFRSLIHHSSDVTLVIDDSRYTYVSPSVTNLLGYTPEELLGSTALDLVHDDDRERVRQRFSGEGGVGTDSVFLQFRMLRTDGTTRTVEAVITDQRNRPAVGGFVANVRDITERKDFEALLAHQALHDPLTGLANRALTIDRAEQMLLRARRTGEPVSLCYIDLDNFKDTNDSLGHEAGDRLLQAVAARFTGILRSSDTVGRLGGDEFVILAGDLSMSDGPMGVAERIRSALHEPFQLEGYRGLPINVTASVGIAVGDRPSAQELLRDADVALYQAKEAGRDCCVLFEPFMQAAAVDRLEMKSALHTALDNDEFYLLYQPIFDLRGDRVRSVEALIRWQHPTRGFMTPDEFIPVLEDNGLIVSVGRWVLMEACRQTAEWQHLGFDVSISVNVSMRQLETEDLVTHVQEALDASGLAPSSLMLEVTESALMRDANATVRRLQRLKEVGVGIAIDDFGTGQSSLTYLRRFPIDELKIDRSFVSAMDGSPASVALIHTLVELGRTLGLVTVAEGIEDMLQLHVLRQEQCECGQGFMFARPMLPNAIAGFLTRGQPSGTAPTRSLALPV